jgi:transcriptional regulator with XRE-family HTH domain
MKTFGQRIQEARKAKGLTLEQLAKVIKSHKGYISGIEHGKVNAPSPKMIPPMCRKLDLPLEEMAALAYWEKAPKDVTAGALLALLEDVITAEQLTEPKKAAV